jgi:hypothetical protein
VDVAAVFDRADTILAEVHKLSPELASAEDDWFAEGMPNSPFVVFVESSVKAQEGRATGT